VSKWALRDHGEAERVWHSRAVRLVLGGKGGIVSISDSNSSTGRTSQRNRASPSPAFQNGAACPVRPSRRRLALPGAPYGQPEGRLAPSAVPIMLSARRAANTSPGSMRGQHNPVRERAGPAPRARRFRGAVGSVDRRHAAATGSHRGGRSATGGPKRPGTHRAGCTEAATALPRRARCVCRIRRSLRAHGAVTAAAGRRRMAAVARP
jgi:hypothetical protein